MRESMDGGKNCCGNCKYHRYDREHKGWACDNNLSDNYGDWTDYECHCEEWEERE